MPGLVDILYINTEEKNIQQIVLPFATQAMTDARREALMVNVIAYWDKPRRGIVKRIVKKS